MRQTKSGMMLSAVKKVTKEGNAVKPSSWEFEGSRREIRFVAAYYRDIIRYSCQDR